METSGRLGVGKFLMDVKMENNEVMVNVIFVLEWTRRGESITEEPLKGVRVGGGKEERYSHECAWNKSSLK